MEGRNEQMKKEMSHSTITVISLYNYKHMFKIYSSLSSKAKNNLRKAIQRIFLDKLKKVIQ